MGCALSVLGEEAYLLLGPRRMNLLMSFRMVLLGRWGQNFRSPFGVILLLRIFLLRSDSI